MNIPAISVIIPAYNAEKYIGEAIRSVNAQTMSEWELIVVDDCSTDRTCEIVEGIMESDGRVRLVRSDVNSGGAMVPRMRGIAMAASELVVAIDADDFIVPGYLEAMLARRAATGAEMVYSFISFSSADGSVTPYVPAEGFDADRVYQGHELVIHTLGGWKVGASGSLMERDRVTAIYRKFVESGHRTDYPFADELLTRVILAETPVVAFSRNSVYLYRINTDSVTHRPITPVHFSRFNLMRELLEWSADTFGEDSEEYAVAQKMNMECVIDTMRLLNGLHGAELRRLARENIRRNYALIDWTRVRRVVSPGFYAVMKLGPVVATSIFRLHWRFISPK